MQKECNSSSLTSVISTTLKPQLMNELTGKKQTTDIILHSKNYKNTCKG